MLNNLSDSSKPHNIVMPSYFPIGSSAPVNILVTDSSGASSLIAELISDPVKLQGFVDRVYSLFLQDISSQQERSRSINNRW
jgi:hypothetical protein